MNTNYKTIFGGAALSERVAIYVPGTCGPATADAALADSMTARAAARLSELFGGATISVAAGAWMSDTHGLIREAVNIVYSYCTPAQLNDHARDVLALAQEVKREMAQEAVSVEVNSSLYLI